MSLQEWAGILGLGILALVATFVIAVYVTTIATALIKDKTRVVVCMVLPPTMVLFLFGLGDGTGPEWQIVAVATFALVTGWLGGQLAYALSAPLSSRTPSVTDEGEER